MVIFSAVQGMVFGFSTLPIAGNADSRTNLAAKISFGRGEALPEGSTPRWPGMVLKFVEDLTCLGRCHLALSATNVSGRWWLLAVL